MLIIVIWEEQDYKSVSFSILFSFIAFDFLVYFLNNKYVLLS